MPDKAEMIRSQLSRRVEDGLALGEANYRDLIASASIAYEAVHRTKMPEMRKALLASALDQYAGRCRQKSIPAEFIKQAAENVSDVENPISMMFALISALVPNFSYMDVAATQPMPTEKSPFFFQQLTAKTARNGVAAGAQLLGATSWDTSNLYTTNRNREAIVGSASPWTLTTAMKPLEPGTVKVKSSDGSIVLKDNRAGGFTVVKGTVTLGTATVNYSTGEISIATTAGSLTGGKVEYRFDMDAYDPVQVSYEWATKEIESWARRIRTVYGLENYYAAKQVLKGQDIDKLMSDAVMGFINKEISCGVYEDMLDEAYTTITWDKKLPSGVSWAFHRLSILEKLVTASNALRKSIKRGGGNILVLSTDWMNVVETLGDDLWKPASVGGREPIGPYTAGVLADKFTVVKNQEFADDVGFMSYKADDTDASFAVGVFIPLYDTDPIALDDLKVRRGIGTSMGSTPILDNSIIELQVIDSTT